MSDLAGSVLILHVLCCGVKIKFFTIVGPFLPYSLQFDPAPRRGEPLVTRRIPDYFM